MNEKRLFLIEKDGSVVSWCPDDMEVQNSRSLWPSLVEQLENGFGKIDLTNEMLKYHPRRNAINVSNDKKKKNELNEKNIEIYCNLLKSSKSNPRMYFYIGDVNEIDKWLAGIKKTMFQRYEILDKMIGHQFVKFAQIAAICKDSDQLFALFDPQRGALAQLAIKLKNDYWNKEKSRGIRM